MDRCVWIGDCQGSCPKKSCCFLECFFERSGVDWVEGFGANGLPIAGFLLDPALRLLGAFGLVEMLSSGEEEDVLAVVFLLRGDKPQGAVAMLLVVPRDELVGPLSGFPELSEAFWRQGGMVFAGAEEGFGVGVVVADAGPRVGRSDAQLIHQRQDGSCLEGAAVVAVQDYGRLFGSDFFGQTGPAQKGLGVLGVLLLPDLSGNDLAAKEVEDDVEFEKASGEGRGQPGDVPAPDLVGSRSGVCGLGRGRLGGSGAATVVLLIGLPQETVKTRFGGDVLPVVGEFDDDLGGGLGGVRRQVALPQDFSAFGNAQGVGWRRPRRPGSAVGGIGAPAFKRARAQAEDFGAFALAGSGLHGFVDKKQDFSAIRGTGQASSSPQIASAFFRSTKRAAVSARAFSLRRNSFSSSRMRARSPRWRRS